MSCVSSIEFSDNKIELANINAFAKGRYRVRTIFTNIAEKQKTANRYRKKSLGLLPYLPYIRRSIWSNKSRYN